MSLLFSDSYYLQSIYNINVKNLPVNAVIIPKLHYHVNKTLRRII